MYKAYKVIAAVIAVGLVVGVVVFTKSTDKRDQATSKIEKVTIGIQTSPAMAVVMVAKDKGFFEQQGLEVELKEFTAGKFALEAFLGGSLDYAVSGDVPAGLALMNKQEFIVPAQVVLKTQNEVRVVANKDGSITDTKTYFTSKKRKLATSIGGGPEFFTYEFLNKLGITKDQVEIISQTPADMPAALASGSVDAIAIFDPMAYKAEKLLGDKVITFTEPDIYSEVYIVEAKSEEKTHPERVRKLLSALTTASKFIENYPTESQAIVSKFTKLDTETVKGIWPSFKFGVGLTPELNEFWDRQYAWAKETGKIKPDTVKPVFMEALAPGLWMQHSTAK